MKFSESFLAIFLPLFTKRKWVPMCLSFSQVIFPRLCRLFSRPYQYTKRVLYTHRRSTVHSRSRQSRKQPWTSYWNTYGAESDTSPVTSLSIFINTKHCGAPRNKPQLRGQRPQTAKYIYWVDGGKAKRRKKRKIINRALEKCFFWGYEQIWREI